MEAHTSILPPQKKKKGILNSLCFSKFRLFFLEILSYGYLFLFCFLVAETGFHKQV